MEMQAMEGMILVDISRLKEQSSDSLDSGIWD